ncbi:hypothetical protein DCAR_0104114 [Daucus carota subsp. sativus]|uniref:START domain-containing protein n=1 Tax=Daucus carota subsp. sativus TaxID=79200 RepID=A0A166IKA8_DAUCS|nr:hypothetical protein DCAR_0104114 [Daucus carota subsp. sativus]
MCNSPSGVDPGRVPLEGYWNCCRLGADGWDEDRPSWFRDCRCLDVLSVIPTGNGGTIELIYMQICERSLTSLTGGPPGPPATCFVRADMLPSGCLIRPCDGGGSIINIVDHVNLDYLNFLCNDSYVLYPWSVPKVLRPLGFNDAVNGFLDDGWSILGSDGVEDVTIAINSNPGKYNNTLSILPTFGGVLCAKASMLLQHVPPALLVRFPREHRSEWADYAIDAYSAASLQSSPYAIPYARPGGFPGTQVILPLADTV